MVSRMSSSSTLRGVTAAALFAVALAPATTSAQRPGAVPTTRADSSLVVQSGAPAAAAHVDTAASDAASASARRLSPPAIIGRRDLALAAGFTAAAVALFPLDRQITAWMRSPERLDNAVLKGTMAGAEWGVEKGSLIAAAGLWGTGLAARNRTVAEMGFHTLASIAVTQQVTQLLKGAFGRSRPYYSADSMPNDWQWGTGFGQSDRRSFPSGHSSLAFASATALSHELSQAWPKAGRVATPLLYAGATGAALARVYHDQHWASDVTLGAAVGILSARATLRLLHGRPGNVLDRVALHTRIVPRADGATVAVTLPAP
jgi:membrane-associated phospholipid phosphatase